MNKAVTFDMLIKRDAPKGIAGMIGTKHGRLSITGFAGMHRNTPYLNALCECGTEIIANAYHVRRGKSASCGCLSVDLLKARLTKHGFAPLKGKRRSIYHIWKGMIKRCSNPNDSHWKYYGGRGIRVCERWSGENGFVNFLADMGEPAPGMSIERKDNDKDYCPENCVWIPLKDQAKNRKYNWTVSINGETMTAREATRRLGLPKNAIATFLRKGRFCKGDVVPLEKLELA